MTSASEPPQDLPPFAPAPHVGRRYLICGDTLCCDGQPAPFPGSQDLLPPAFAAWFAARGWSPRLHQMLLLQRARDGASALLAAPTGAGKTLSGFLATLVDLAGADPPCRRRLHTLYVSPLKALAVDVARNLETPVREMGLDLSVETRTGDTPAHKRARQMRAPPAVLMTTPEQVALMLAHPDAEALFGGLQRIVLDELHALAQSKRGDLLALDLARLRRLAPGVSITGLSATVREPEALARYISGVGPSAPAVDVIRVEGGAPPHISILHGRRTLPVAGHTTAWAMPEVYEAIRSHRLTLVFVNTRLQAEFTFQELWRLNEDSLPIALHHGSLDAARRRRVEAAMTEGRLKAVVCTATLDLGVDWGDVDLVINLGAPKGASRLMQRIGRANHRLDEPSRAWLAPSNRFEALECEAALELVEEAAQDTPDMREGALDVLAQHVLGMAVAGPFSAHDLYAEVSSAAPYARLTRDDFDAVLSFVATGGYALRSYEQFARIRQDSAGRWRIATPAAAQRYRMNVGAIVDNATVRVRLARRRPMRPDGRPAGASGSAAPSPSGRGASGRVLGEVEEGFIEQLTLGDTFIFAGEVLRFEGLSADEALVTRAIGKDPKIPAWAGGRFPLSTFLAARVRSLLADADQWRVLPPEVQALLSWQREHSSLPGPDELLVETFPRAGRFYLVLWPFEGRLAHQTLGVLLTRRLERAGLRPLGFVANDYGLAIWAAGDIAAALAVGEDAAIGAPGLRPKSGARAYRLRADVAGADHSPTMAPAAAPAPAASRSPRRGVTGPRLSLDALLSEDILGDDLEEWLEETALMKRAFRQCAVIAGLVERRHPGLGRKTGRQVTISTDLVFDVLRRYQPDHILLRAARQESASNLLDLKRLGDMLARIRGRVLWRRLGRISPLAVSLVLEIGREAAPGGDDFLLAEAEAALMEEATSRRQ